MSKYIDYDKLDDNILALNEKGWEITRGEYKRIQSVMFEMIELEIPNNATNGEVIKALFPQAEVKECYKDIYGKPHLYRVYKLDIYPTEFTEEFWNAPYKKGENE